MTKQTTKYLIVESPVHGEPVLLAFVPHSQNTKTGDMVQIYIMHPDQNPLETSKLKLDDRVCGNCPLRHSLGGACYVTLFHGPNRVYNSWSDKGKKIDPIEEALEIVLGRAVRIGAYGDIAHIPDYLAAEIMSLSNSYTAYTHAWRNPVVARVWKGRAMASCDTAGQLRLAESQGWAGFVAVPEELDGVKICDNEENGTQCRDCLKCDGSQGSVQLTPHGARLKKHPSMRKGK
jgi:hypothetical protein